MVSEKETRHIDEETMGHCASQTQEYQHKSSKIHFSVFRRGRTQPLRLPLPQLLNLLPVNIQSITDNFQVTRNKITCDN